MSTEALVSTLLAVVGALLLVIWSSVIYEIRQLRKTVHDYKGKVSALNAMVGVICHCANIDWVTKDLEKRDD